MALALIPTSGLCVGTPSRISDKLLCLQLLKLAVWLPVCLTCIGTRQCHSNARSQSHQVCPCLVRRPPAKLLHRFVNVLDKLINITQRYSGQPVTAAASEWSDWCGLSDDGKLVIFITNNGLESTSKPIVLSGKF